MDEDRSQKIGGTQKLILGGNAHYGQLGQDANHVPFYNVKLNLLGLVIMPSCKQIVDLHEGKRKRIEKTYRYPQ